MWRVVIAVVALIVVAGIGAAAWLVFGDRRLPVAPVTVEVPPGESVAGISRQLADAGIVSSDRLLALYVRAKHLGSTIQAADYDFPAHLTLPEVTAILQSGGRTP